MQLTQNTAQIKAQNWVDAWNKRDLDAVMTHYADDVSVCSPLVKRRLNNSDGWLHGKSALRDYLPSVWEILICNLRLNPFTLACNLCRWFMHVKTEFRLLIRWS